MAIGREDFEAGVDGDALSQVMNCLANDKALTQTELQESTGLDTKSLVLALGKLEELGKIRTKQFESARYFLKVASVPHQQWYTLDEAANYLRVSRRTIYQLLQKSQLASYRLGQGGHRRIKQSDLDHVMVFDEGEDLYAMNAVSDPVLAELWDNEKDAEYDNL